MLIGIRIFSTRIRSGLNTLLCSVFNRKGYDKHLNRIQVVPLTSNVARLYPSEAYVTLGGEQRKAVADQLTTVSKERLSGQVGVLNRDDLGQIERAVRVP